MSERFEVGEVAIMLPGTSEPDLNLDRYDYTEVAIDRPLTVVKGESYYGVQVPGGPSLWVKPKCLRKKRPPQETTTWDKCV